MATKRGKYVTAVYLIAGSIVFPGICVNFSGIGGKISSSIAAIQLFALIPFLATSLVSAGFGIHALAEKNWRGAPIYFGAALIPFVTFWMAMTTNTPGWEALMGI